MSANAITLGWESSLPGADALLALAARDFPDSVPVVVDRGDLNMLSADDPRRALVHYERALARGMDARDGVCRGRPHPLKEGAAQRLVDVYGPRRVTFENSRLFSQRNDGPKSALIPMSADLFTLDGNPSFRLQFVTDGSEGFAAATKVDGHYLGGRRDQNARTP